MPAAAGDPKSGPTAAAAAATHTHKHTLSPRNAATTSAIQACCCDQLGAQNGVLRPSTHATCPGALMLGPHSAAQHAAAPVGHSQPQLFASQNISKRSLQCTTAQKRAATTAACVSAIKRVCCDALAHLRQQSKRTNVAGCDNTLPGHTASSLKNENPAHTCPAHRSPVKSLTHQEEAA